METIDDKIRKILVDQFGVEVSTITPETRFIEDLHGDSLDCAETLMAIEETFGIEIADEDALRFRTVQDLVTYLLRR